MTSIENIDDKKKTSPEVSDFTPSQPAVLRSALADIKKKNALGKTKRFYWIRMILIVTDVLSVLIGVYILFHKSFYLSPTYKFSYYKWLVGFLLVYASGMVGIIVLSFIIASLFYLWYCCCFKPKKFSPVSEGNANDVNISISANEIDANKDKEYISIDTSIEKALYDSQKAKLFPYTFTIFIILTIALYFIALPYGGFLIYKLLCHEKYKDYKAFLMLYLFCGLNIIDGLLMVGVFFAMMLLKNKENSMLKKSMELDENYIKSIRRDVEIEMNKAK